VNTGLSSLLGGVTGIAQLTSGLVRSKQADGLKPPKEDPEERRFLNDITRKRTGYGTGSAVSALTDKINQATWATKEGVFQTAGGEGGATLASLGRVSKSSSSSVNDILSQAEQQTQYFSNMQSALLGKIAQRKLELSMYEYATDKAAGESLIAAGTDNIAGAKGMGASKGGSQVSSQMSQGKATSETQYSTPEYKKQIDDSQFQDAPIQQNDFMSGIDGGSFA